MPLKDLSGKTVHDPDREDFEKLFCRQCKDEGICSKGDKTVLICMGLIDAGAWDLAFRKHH
jgi:hypothetical protein